MPTVTVAAQCDTEVRIPPAVVHLLLEDVTLADAPAMLVARADFELPGRDVSAGHTVFLHTFDWAGLDSKRASTTRLELRIHVDISRTGDVTAGDLVSHEALPISTASRSVVAARLKVVR